MASNNKKKILIYLFGSLGDTIVAIPALRAVRRHFQNDELILMQNSSADEIVKVSQVIPEGLIDGYFNYENPEGKLNKILNTLRLRSELRRQNFHAAVYLILSERPAKSVARDRLFFRLCGINKLLGFHSFSEKELYPVDKDGRPTMTEHEAIRKLNRLKKDGIEILSEDSRLPLMEFSENTRAKVERWLADQRKNKSAKLVAIAPGCKTTANTWSVENFTEIGRRLLAENYELMVVGGKGDYELGNKMISAWGTGINAAGKFSVSESGALLSLCDFYIGLDTGSTHLAAAVETRCFTLYGERNNDGQWFPFGGGHYILSHRVECAGCRHLTCPLPENICMTGMTVDAVWEKLKDFLRDETQNDLFANDKIQREIKLIYL